LPHGWGDRPSPASPPDRRRLWKGDAGAAGVISPPVGEMSGRTEGGVKGAALTIRHTDPFPRLSAGSCQRTWGAGRVFRASQLVFIWRGMRAPPAILMARSVPL